MPLPRSMRPSAQAQTGAFSTPESGMTNKPDGQKRQLAAHLGRAYLLGDKLPWDFEKAREHLEQAAAAGDPVSMGVLGYMQVMGLGGPENEARGYEWIETAADMGEPGAHFGLAAKYGQGVGVECDPIRSLGQAPPYPAA